MNANYPDICEFDSDYYDLLIANKGKTLAISVSKKVLFCSINCFFITLQSKKKG